MLVNKNFREAHDTYWFRDGYCLSQASAKHVFNYLSYVYFLLLENPFFIIIFKIWNIFQFDEIVKKSFSNQHLPRFFNRIAEIGLLMN